MPKVTLFLPFWAAFPTEFLIIFLFIPLRLLDVAGRSCSVSTKSCVERFYNETKEKLMNKKRHTIIPINEEFRLTADKHQWIIQQVRTRKGKTDWESQWYFSSIQGALNHLGEVMVRVSGAQTLAEALKAVENVTTTLSQALTPKIEDRGYQAKEDLE